jgi:hypothetical protein
MAEKEQLSPVQQHVEKGVLVAAAVVLIVAFVHWGFSSPRSIELGGKEVDLKEADDIILQKVDARQEQATRLKPEKHPELTFVKEFRRLRDKPLPQRLVKIPGGTLAPPQRTLATADLWEPYPEVKPIKPTVVKVEDKRPELVVMTPPAPGEPKVWVGRELRRTGEPQEPIVAHVAAVYPYDELYNLWNQRLAATPTIPLRVAVAGVRLYRQERLADGRWSNWRVVQTAAAGGDGEIVPAPNYSAEVPQYTGQNATEVRQAMQRLADEKNIAAVLTPPYPDVYLPTQEWGPYNVHLPENEVSRKAIEEGMTVDERRFERVPTGTRGTVAPGTGVPGRPIRPGAGEYPRYEEYEEYDPERFRELYRRPGSPSRAPSRRPAPAPGGSRAPIPGAAGTPPGAEAAGEVTPVRGEAMPIPPLRTQMVRGKLLVVAHDTSLEPRKEYRWRMQVVLVNPLLSYDGVNEARHRADARERFVESSQSPPSPIVSVPEEKHIFLVGQFGTQKVGRVMVYMRRLGRVFGRGFSVREGDAIGGAADVVTNNPRTGEQVRLTLDFNTGAVVLELDFDKQVIRSNIPRTTVEMLYANDEGRLRRTIKILDMPRDSEPYLLYQRLSAEAEQARAKLGP